MNKRTFEEWTHRELIAILLGLAYVFLMFGNGMVSLTHPDEVFYAQSAKEMIRHKSWLTPLIFDSPQFEKPVFFYWLLILAFKAFGTSFFVARFWPAFFGIVGVIATYWLSFMLFQNKRLSFLSGFILLTSFIYLALSRSILTDMVFSIWVTLALAFFYLCYQYPRHRKAGLVAFWLCAAIAVLTKGILGVTFPLMIALSFLSYVRDFSIIKNKYFWIGFFIFLLVALPWHIVMAKWYGHNFIYEYIYNVHIRRIFEAEHPKSNTWYFYLGTVWTGVFPWSLLLIPALILFFRQLDRASHHAHSLFFLLFWMATVYTSVQVAQSKLASYIFPIFPATAIVIAYYLNDALTKINTSGQNQALKFCIYGMSIFFIIMAAGAVVASSVFKEMVTDKGPIYIFSFLAILMSCLLLAFMKKRKYTLAVLSHAGITVSILIMLFGAKSYIEPWVSCKNITDIFKEIDQPPSVVLTSKFYVRGVRYYTQRPMAVIDLNGKGFFSPHPIPFLSTEKGVLEFLNHQPLTYAIVKEGNVGDLKRIIQEKPFRLEELGGSGGKYILRISKIVK